MSQAYDKVSWEVKPWAGTLVQLHRAAERCQAAITDIVPYPRDYDPEDTQQYERGKHQQWEAAEQGHRVDISVVERDGFSRQLTELADLADLDSGHLDRITGIDIKLGGFRDSPSAEIAVSDFRGLTVNLVGPDRTWTAGLRHELEDGLAPPSRLQLIRLPSDVYGWLGVWTFSILFPGLVAFFRAATDWASAALLLVAGGLAALTGSVVAYMGVGLPAFELLAPGQKPAFHARRARLVGAFSVVAVGIATSLIAAGISK